MNTLIILSIIYIASVLGMWFQIKKDYSKGGDMEGKELKLVLLLITFLPILNTIALGFCLLVDYVLKENSTNELLSKFYKIKK